MSEGYLIYALRLSSEDRYRYIGKTTKGYARYEDHLNKARWGLPSAKYDWIRSHDTSKIEFVVLEDCPDGDDVYLNQAEIRWIAYGYAEGHPLLNHTSGGDGGATRTGMKTPELTKEKQRVALTKRRHSDSTKKKMSDIRRSELRPVCCLLCRGEFMTGLNLTNHLYQSHDPEVIRLRLEKKLEKNLASNHERLGRYYARYPEGSSGSCVKCRLSFGYPGLKSHMNSTHGITIPSSHKKPSRARGLDKVS